MEETGSEDEKVVDRKNSSNNSSANNSGQNSRQLNDTNASRAKKKNR